MADSLDDGLCAVVGCSEPGKSQVCAGDGRYHHHGRVHTHPDTPVKGDGWRYICDAHMAEDKARWERGGHTYRPSANVPDACSHCGRGETEAGHIR